MNYSLGSAAYNAKDCLFVCLKSEVLKKGKENPEQHCYSSLTLYIACKKYKVVLSKLRHLNFSYREKGGKNPQHELKKEKQQCFESICVHIGFFQPHKMAGISQQTSPPGSSPIGICLK